MWLVFALLSALFAALTSIFAKVGIEGVNSNLATALRTIVVLIMALLFQGFADWRRIEGRAGRQDEHRHNHNPRGDFPSRKHHHKERHRMSSDSGRHTADGVVEINFLDKKK